MSLAGGCRCGAVRYTLALDALPPAYACHCRDCQSWSGSAFTQQIVIEEALLSVTGPIVDYRFDSPSGAKSHQRICGICHARIFNTSSITSHLSPGIAVVRAGTLDRSDEIDTTLHIWTKRKQPWVALPRDAEIYPEAPTFDAIGRMIARA